VQTKSGHLNAMFKRFGVAHGISTELVSFDPTWRAS
jgi:hypothetical protein